MVDPRPRATATGCAVAERLRYRAPLPAGRSPPQPIVLSRSVSVKGPFPRAWHSGQSPCWLGPARSDRARELPAISCSSAEPSCRAGTSMIEPHRVHTAWWCGSVSNLYVVTPPSTVNACSRPLVDESSHRSPIQYPARTVASHPRKICNLIASPSHRAGVGLVFCNSVLFSHEGTRHGRCFTRPAAVVVV